MHILNISYRSIITLIFLFFLTKMLGKKQISQLSLFDYVVGITFGNIAADISLDIEKDLIAGLVSLFIYGFFAFLISYITKKCIKLRRFFIGVPTILVENGKIIECGLTKCKIDVNELLAEARGQGYFDLSEINYAIMETDGNISFLPYEWAKNSTKKDLKIKTNDNALVANLIIDGKILDNNLKCINKDKEWLLHELKVKGHKIEDILLATLDNKNKFTIYRKGINPDKNTILE